MNYREMLLIGLGTISAVFTAFYSFRLISLTFFTVPNAPKGDYLHTHEAPMIIVIPLVILINLSIMFGYVAKDLFVGSRIRFLIYSTIPTPRSCITSRSRIRITIIP